MNVMIAIPTLDYVHVRFVESLTDLTKRMTEAGIQHTIVYQTATMVYTARDNLARKAIEEGYSHVLWLDADMVFDDDIFEKLNAHDKDMVCAGYRSRHGEKRLIIWKKLDHDEMMKTIDTKELTEIEGCGFGCVLMKTDILRKMRGHLGFTETFFMPTRRFGEDLAFCERAVKLGIKIFMDPSAWVSHIGQMLIDPNGEVFVL